jgi:hypothetical protein
MERKPSANPFPTPLSNEGMRQQDLSHSFCNWIRVDDAGDGPALLQARGVRLRIHEAWLTSTPGNVVPGSRFEDRVIVVDLKSAGEGVLKMLTDLHDGAELRVTIREEMGHPLQNLWKQVPPKGQIHLRARLEAMEEL